VNTPLLKKHIASYIKKIQEDPAKYQHDLKERLERTRYYQAWSRVRMLAMTADELYEYLSPLWAMLIWGNKHYVVDKLINNHGLDHVRNRLAELVWGLDSVDARWEIFRKNVKGIGPAMISEILCHSHPDQCMVWNRRALVGLKYLGVADLPRYDYQVTGTKYLDLTKSALNIRDELDKAGIPNPSLLTVDYFIWGELQVEGNLGEIFSKPSEGLPPVAVQLGDAVTSEFIHDEVRDKLAEVGKWLGFSTTTETKVADGSVIDTLWEATIGNMGRVIYVFEVQTKGSIDSLIVNLLKALNNPAVQGVVAVSDGAQIDKIKKHAAGVPGLNTKLRYWNYLEVLEIHTALQGVNEAINGLGLVPQGF
jgi:hypothetical protein